MTAPMPQDSDSAKMQLVPAKEPLAITYDTTITLGTETEVTLNAATSLVEISAINTPIFMKMKTAAGGAAVSSTNFSAFIGAGLTRHYKINKDITVLSFVEQSASATLVLIEY